MSEAIEISGDLARELLRSIAAGMSDQARLQFLAESLPLEARQQAFKELLFEIGLLTAEQAGQLVQWSERGFQQIAHRHNCPVVKLGHKQPSLYRFRDVDQMLQRLRAWPKGKPSDPPALVAA